jgi:hypothetical protein
LSSPIVASFVVCVRVEIPLTFLGTGTVAMKASEGVVRRGVGSVLICLLTCIPCRGVAAPSMPTVRACERMDAVGEDGVGVLTGSGASDMPVPIARVSAGSVASSGAVSDTGAGADHFRGDPPSDVKFADCSVAPSSRVKKSPAAFGA